MARENIKQRHQLETKRIRREKEKATEAEQFKNREKKIQINSPKIMIDAF